MAQAIFQPLFVRAISAGEKESLELSSASSNAEEARRAQVILLSQDGKTAAEIRQALGFHPTNIKKWIRSFNQDGLAGIAANKRGRHGGPRPKFAPEAISQILNIATTAPSEFGYAFKEWTPQKLATAAVEKGVVNSVSHVTVRQILRRGSVTAATSVSPGAGNRPPFGSAVSVFELGKRALEESKFEEAVRCFYDAISSEGLSLDEEAIARSMLSQALQELSQFDEAHTAIEKYQEAHSLIGLSAMTRARAKLAIGWANHWLGRSPEAIASSNEAIRLFSEVGDLPGVSEAHYGLGTFYTKISEYRICRDHLLAAVNLQQGGSNRDLLARIYHMLGLADFHEGAFSAAKENYLKALEIGAGSSNTNLLGLMHLDLG